MLYIDVPFQEKDEVKAVVKDKGGDLFVEYNWRY